MRNTIVAILACAAVTVTPTLAAEAQARFGQPARVEFSGDGRRVTLLRAFTFTDDREVVWTVPRNAVVDGASIPKPFWSLIGGPFEGFYRDASIIHDYYCERKSRPWKQVHRVFYDGMIARGVALPQAKLMYFAVYKFGPRWEERVTRVPGLSFSGTPVMIEESVTIDLPAEEYDPDLVAQAQALIASGADVEQLEALAETTGVD